MLLINVSISLRVGGKVIHPQHGVCKVIKRIRRVPPTMVMPEGDETQHEEGASEVAYLVLEVPPTEGGAPQMLMEMRETHARSYLRAPIPVDEIEDVFATLKKRDIRETSTWSRRQQIYEAKLADGDIYLLAEVVRNLAVREQLKHISISEERKLKAAHKRLCVELSVTSRKSYETLSKEVTEACTVTPELLAA